jgi:adenylate kinase family enzyme
MAAILDTGRCWRTQFWKGTTQGSFQQSLVEIGSVVSEEKNCFLISSLQMAKNCSILCQKVPKFELYKHNDELFNIYYGIFYELWTFAYFDRLCKLEKRGK